MKKLLIPTLQGMKFINPLDISFLKAINNYTEIYLTQNYDKILIYRSLGVIEKHLSNEIFFRCHRTYIININQIAEYNCFTGGGIISLHNGQKIRLAKRRKKQFLEIIKPKYKILL